MDSIADVMAQRSKDPKLITRLISFELVKPICPRYINVTDRQTDGRIDDLRQEYRALHYVHRPVEIENQSTFDELKNMQ